MGIKLSQQLTHTNPNTNTQQQTNKCAQRQTNSKQQTNKHAQHQTNSKHTSARNANTKPQNPTIGLISWKGLIVRDN
jgi:hypothetical protein